MQETISDTQWQTFQDLGSVRLGRVVTDEELEELRRRIDEIMLGTAPVPYDRIMMQLDTRTGRHEDMDPQTKGHKGATLAYRKMQGLEFDPLLLAYMQKPLFHHICQRAYGKGTPVTTFRAMFMNKPALQGTVLPWHRDYFRQMDRPPEITIWLALDNATSENGCIQVLAGSHHLYSDDNATLLLDEEQTEEVLGEHTPETLECSAGHAILLHNRLLHTSDVNPTSDPRRAFSVCYMDGRAKDDKDTKFSMIFGEGALHPETLGMEA